MRLKIYDKHKDQDPNKQTSRHISKRFYSTCNGIYWYDGNSNSDGDGIHLLTSFIHAAYHFLHALYTDGYIFIYTWFVWMER